MEREAFLKAAREALGKGRDGVRPDAASPFADAAKLKDAGLTEPARQDDQHREELVRRLRYTAAARGWHVAQASDIEQAIDYVVKVAMDASASLVVRSAQDIFSQLPVDGALAERGVQTTVMGGGEQGRQEANRQAAATAQLGITGVDYAIAETGSVVLLPDWKLSRLTSLLPPVHLAIVRPQEVLDTLDDFFLLRRHAYYREGEMARYVNFITGPSRTADIEQQIVIGVHGPRQVHMLIWESDQG